MEESVELSSHVNQSPVLEVEESTMEAKSLDNQCGILSNYVPNLDDLDSSVNDLKSKKEEILVGVSEIERETSAVSDVGSCMSELNNSGIVGDGLSSLDRLDKDSEAVAKEESLIADGETNTVSGGVNFVHQARDSHLGGAGDGVVAKEADTIMAMEQKADAIGESGCEAEAEAKVELKAEAEVEAKEVKTQFEIGVESLIVAKSDDVVVEGEGEGEIPSLENRIETKPVVENDNERENIGEVQGEEVVGLESPNADGEVAVRANSELIGAGLHNVAEDAAMEENNLVEKTVKEAEVEKEGGKSVPQLDDSQLAEDVVMGAEDETPAADTERDTEKEDLVDGAEYSTPLDDSQLFEEEEEDDDRTVAEEECLAADTEMETETDAVESVKVSGGKRKRGRKPKVPTKSPMLKTMTCPVEEEDVCFICFDGGDLVLCDRKNCPKAYHPSCVNRDEKYFRAKGRWNCGWHQCSNCNKNAHYMCYTCMFSLCKGCIKDSVILCVRGNKGFCEGCMKILMLIEDNEQGNKAQVDFDDKSSWEYLFKDYWIDLKERLSLSSVELAQAKNPWKGSDLASKHDSLDGQVDVNDDGGLGSDNPSDNPEASKPKTRKSKKRLKSLAKEEELRSEAVAVGAEGIPSPKNTEWASKELLEFVMHMKDGDRSVLSQFDVQALLLEYIKKNKLRDPRRKSQIVCDARLENLFGKARVGHFEMLKLLESHFLTKENAQIDDVQGSVVDTEVNHVDADVNTDSLTKGGKDRKRKIRKKDGRGRQSNLDDYAAIDIHNVSLIYLKRKLMEDLLEDVETFHDKVVGTFVRIRISGSNQKQDIYRLVQVLGTSKAAERYKVGKRTTDIMLEILNLNKTEVIPIDTISNQEFTEDECKRLRQSIKCGLINRMTVGDILDKAMEVQAARVNDWLESETLRLSHLRDRASDLGQKKNLRECVEKLQLLKTPEERRRKLEDIPQIHADPKMDPSFESEDDDSEMDREAYMRRGSGFNRRGREPISPRNGDLRDSWSGGKNLELNRNWSSKNLANTVEEGTLNVDISADNSRDQGRDKDTEQSINVEKSSRVISSEAIGLNSHSNVGSESFSRVASKTSQKPAPVATMATNISETDKMWNYQDPSGKVQGPFSMVQLRKWSKNGYFPADLKIWRTTGNQDDSILLTDALAGKFPRDLPLVDNGYLKDDALSTHPPSTHTDKSYENSLQSVREGQGGERLNSDQNHGVLDSHLNLESRGWTAPSVEIPKLSADKVNSDYLGSNNSVSFPSPTPKQSTLAGGDAGTPAAATPISLSGGNETVHSPSTAIPDSNRKAKMISENIPFSSRSGFSAPPNSEQGILIDTKNSLQTSQSTAAVESHGVPTNSHLLPAHETAANMVQPGINQNPAFGTHGWNSSPSKSLETNSSIPMHVQQLAYGQWGGVPSTTVQNPAGNFSTQGVSSMLPSEPWRPPIPNNQPNMQPPAMQNIPWGMGVPDNIASAQNLRPENPYSGWGPMNGNPNMVWGGHVPNPNMNWVAPSQGPLPGNANPGWAVPAGNLGAAFQGAIPGNLNMGWVAPVGNVIPQTLGPGNANQGWVATTGNPGPTAQGPPAAGNGNPGWAAATGNTNQGWVATSGNPGPATPGLVPGNGNPGWVAPTGNVNQGWVAATGNPGVAAQGPVPGNGSTGWAAPTGKVGANVQGPPSGNSNPGWGGSPAGNKGDRRSEHHHRGDRFSGRRDWGSQGGNSGSGGGRPWNRQSSFGGGGGGPGSSSRLCEYYHQMGHCKKGANCNLRHD